MALTRDALLEMAYGREVPAVSDTPDTLYRGALLNFEADGHVIVAADTSGTIPAGICAETVVIGSGETKDVKVIRGALAWLPMSGAAQTDVGNLVYALSDDAVVAAASNVAAFGKAVAFRTGYVLVDMNDRTA